MTTVKAISKPLSTDTQHWIHVSIAYRGRFHFHRCVLSQHCLLLPLIKKTASEICREWKAYWTARVRWVTLEIAEPFKLPFIRQVWEFSARSLLDWERHINARLAVLNRKFWRWSQNKNVLIALKMGWWVGAKAYSELMFYISYTLFAERRWKLTHEYVIKI